MLNKVTLIGNLGKDPEIRTLENGAKVATFTLATNENYKDKNDNYQTITEWHNIVAWRYLAEKAERDLKKGSLIYVEGKITNRKYTDKDGQDRYISEITANTIYPLDRRDKLQSENNFPNSNNPISSNLNTQSSSSSTSNFDTNDDLPF